MALILNLFLCQWFLTLGLNFFYGEMLLTSFHIYSSSNYFLPLVSSTGVTEAPQLSPSHRVCFLTYDLSIRAEYGRVRSDRGAGGHQADSLPRCLGFDLRYDDVSTGKVLGLTPTLSCVCEDKAVELTHGADRIVNAFLGLLHNSYCSQKLQE